MKTIETKIHVNGDTFILVDAESLAQDDEILRHNPRTEKEKVTKELIFEAIHKGVKNFYRPECDPSFTDDGESICFAPRKRPAVGKGFLWWKKVALSYCPERNSHLETRLQYGAFLGVLIKKLINKGMSIEEAWNAVCNDSRELGHYRNSQNAKRNLELTGSRRICDFCDLINTYKFLANDINPVNFWVAGGSYFDPGYHSLATLVHRNFEHYSDDFTVGQVVLEK